MRLNVRDGATDATDSARRPHSTRCVGATDMATRYFGATAGHADYSGDASATSTDSTPSATTYIRFALYARWAHGSTGTPRLAYDATPDLLADFRHRYFYVFSSLFLGATLLDVYGLSPLSIRRVRLFHLHFVFALTSRLTLILFLPSHSFSALYFSTSTLPTFTISPPTIPFSLLYPFFIRLLVLLLLLLFSTLYISCYSLACATYALHRESRNRRLRLSRER